MTKHTKGPWKAVRSFIVADPSTAPKEYSKTNLEAYGGYLIAESVFHPPNRALIVTAPDMLKTLKLYLEIFESGTFAVPINIEHLRSLIAKAEGEVQ